MTIEIIEEFAHDVELKDEDQKEFERLLNVVVDMDGSFRIWRNLYMVSSVLFFWFVLFSSILFTLSLDIEFDPPAQIGIFLSAVLVVTFMLFILSMFQKERLGRELSSHEARVIAFLGSR